MPRVPARSTDAAGRKEPNMTARDTSAQTRASVHEIDETSKSYTAFKADVVSALERLTARVAFVSDNQLLGDLAERQIDISLEQLRHFLLRTPLNANGQLCIGPFVAERRFDNDNGQPYFIFIKPTRQ